MWTAVCYCTQLHQQKCIKATPPYKHNTHIARMRQNAEISAGIILSSATLPLSFKSPHSLLSSPLSNQSQNGSSSFMSFFFSFSRLLMAGVSTLFEIKLPNWIKCFRRFLTEWALCTVYIVITIKIIHCKLS